MSSPAPLTGQPTSRFSLNRRLVLLTGFPFVGLVIALVASYLGTESMLRSIRQATTETAPLADLARTLQSEVAAIQDDYTDLSATRKQDEMKEKFPASRSAPYRQPRLAQSQHHYPQCRR